MPSVTLTWRRASSVPSWCPHWTAAVAFGASSMPVTREVTARYPGQSRRHVCSPAGFVERGTWSRRDAVRLGTEPGAIGFSTCSFAVTRGAAATARVRETPRDHAARAPIHAGPGVFFDVVLSAV